LGWGLHYLQDLTQPYHSTLVPNVSLTKIILVWLQNSIINHTQEKNLIQLISNRHVTIENYQYNLVKNMLEKGYQSNLLQAIEDYQHDRVYPAYTDQYPRDTIAKESNAAAAEVDSLIKQTFPKKYVQDPQYIFFTTEPPVNMLTVVEHNPTPALNKLNMERANLLRALGSHTRNAVRYALEELHFRKQWRKDLPVAK
jgi:hypothetical protein